MTQPGESEPISAEVRAAIEDEIRASRAKERRHSWKVLAALFVVVVVIVIRWRWAA